MFSINNNMKFNCSKINTKKPGLIKSSSKTSNFEPLSNDIFVKNIKNVKERKAMNNEEKQVKLLNDYVNYNINFETLLQERERLRNNKEFGDESVDENIENLFNNFDEDPDYTQIDFSYDARELINIYREKGKYPNIIKE